ncbi:MAG: hypothetical protein R2911_31425 [Caldilineaceae bacterium]
MICGGRPRRRYDHARDLLCENPNGAEDAIVVNNCASALYLVLIFCRDLEVIISRGQLVEIGGGFRIRMCCARAAPPGGSGDRNRTHARDFADSITAETSALCAFIPAISAKSALSPPLNWANW